ncbi:hypothetical protein H0N96_01260 [Candidatus Micrarchaeota archaeon]|nr:hypothetical protein [Candidatus Micrarchaeota archaeon]
MASKNNKTNTEIFGEVIARKLGEPVVSHETVSKLINLLTSNPKLCKSIKRYLEGQTINPSVLELKSKEYGVKKPVFYLERDLKKYFRYLHEIGVINPLKIRTATPEETAKIAGKSLKLRRIPRESSPIDHNVRRILEK